MLWRWVNARVVRGRWWWLLVVTMVMTTGALAAAWVMAMWPPEHGLLPVFRPDDTVYWELMAQGQVCAHNLTSMLAEGGCRLRPLWWAASWLDFGWVGLGSLIWRWLIWGVVIAAVGWGAGRWARRERLDENRARWWVAVLLVLSPLPLVLVAPYVAFVPEMTLPVSALYSLPNLLSWACYLVAVGGFYVYRERLWTWPIWGTVAGIWTLNHPYYLVFVLSLWAVWLTLGRRWGWRWLVAAVGLVAPAVAVGSYYWWLAGTNEFFRFHLTTNVTRHFAGQQWWLLAGGVMVVGVMIWLWYRAQPRWRLDGYLVSWLVVAWAWLLVPSDTERRMTLVVTLPVVVWVVLIILRLPEEVRRWRPWAAGMLATNGLLLGGVILANSAGLLTAPRIETYVSADDQQLAAWLKDEGAGGSYVADELAAERFLWLAQTRIVNAHQHESPGYFNWQKWLAEAVRGQCGDLTTAVRTAQVSGVISRRGGSLAAGLLTCGYTTRYQTADWRVLAAPVRD